MPEGLVHERATLLLALPTGLGIGILFSVGGFEIGVIGGLGGLTGCLSGLVLMPDLDQETMNRAKWKMVNATLGLGWLFVMYFWPYAKLIEHRAFASHSVFFSTVLRVVYLLWWLPILIWIQGWHVPWWVGIFGISWFIGLCVPDAAHVIMDDLEKKRLTAMRMSGRITAKEDR